MKIDNIIIGGHFYYFVTLNNCFAVGALYFLVCWDQLQLDLDECWCLHKSWHLAQGSD